ncbi:MAG: N-acetyltransferase [Chlorobiaceae bacterium]|nr:N-acetyltransferase [Chlorobiaceae bacterium]NTW10354.1 N-acetyltransferase [Chlorobiaceae bacterium]
MHPEVILRDEKPGEAGEIAEVTVSAFEAVPVSGHTEQFVIEALRTEGALRVSIVAELEARIVGHIAFSPVAISDGTPDWYALGPVSVLPEFQRQGIGNALIVEGLVRVQELGARGCCLVGHPGYYGRFGFVNPQGFGVEEVPEEVFFALPFDGHMPGGSVTFHEAFNAKGGGSAA